MQTNHSEFLPEHKRRIREHLQKQLFDKPDKLFQKHIDSLVRKQVAILKPLGKDSYFGFIYNRQKYYHSEAPFRYTVYNLHIDLHPLMEEAFSCGGKLEEFEKTKIMGILIHMLNQCTTYKDLHNLLPAGLSVDSLVDGDISKGVAHLSDQTVSEFKEQHKEGYALAQQRAFYNLLID